MVRQGSDTWGRGKREGQVRKPRRYPPTHFPRPRRTWPQLSRLSSVVWFLKQDFSASLYTHTKHSPQPWAKLALCRPEMLVRGWIFSSSVVSMRPIATWLLKRGGRCIHTDIHTMLLGRGRSHREHSRPILKGAGEARNPCVVWQAGVTVARRQRRVQECLLRGMMSLRLVLLGLGQGCGWGWGGGVPAAKLGEVTRIWITGQATIPPSQWSGRCRKWDAVVIQWKSCLKHLQVIITIYLWRVGM